MAGCQLKRIQLHFCSFFKLSGKKENKISLHPKILLNYHQQIKAKIVYMHCRVEDLFIIHCSFPESLYADYRGRDELMDCKLHLINSFCSLLAKNAVILIYIWGNFVYFNGGLLSYPWLLKRCQNNLAEGFAINLR